MGPQWLQFSIPLCYSCRSFSPAASMVCWVFPQCWGRHFHPHTAQAVSVWFQAGYGRPSDPPGRALGSGIPDPCCSSPGRCASKPETSWAPLWMAHSCCFLKAAAPVHPKFLFPLKVGSENLKPNRAKNQWNGRTSCGAELQPLCRASPRSTFPPEIWGLGTVGALSIPL